MAIALMCKLRKSCLRAASKPRELSIPGGIPQIQMRNPNDFSVRLIGDQSAIVKPAQATVEGLKRAGYNCLTHSEPRPSRKDPNDARVYLKFNNLLLPAPMPMTKYYTLQFFDRERPRFWFGDRVQLKTFFEGSILGERWRSRRFSLVGGDVGIIYGVRWEPHRSEDPGFYYFCLWDSSHSIRSGLYQGIYEGLLEPFDNTNAQRN